MYNKLSRLYIIVCIKGSFLRIFIIIMLFTITLFAKNEEVILQLNWKHQFQFAGFYIAKEHGYYNDIGLNVTIKEYNNSINVVDDVISQKATYGIGKSSLVISRYQGKPVVLLSSIFQTSPSVLIVTNPKIKSPSDLVSKKIMITNNEASSASIMAMLLSNGVAKRHITIQTHSFDYHDLVNGKTDAMASYLSNEPYQLEKKRVKYKIFDPKDYGYDFYGDLLFTSVKQIQEHHDMNHNFHYASKEGWLWAFDHIEETAQLIYEKYNTQNKSLQSLIYEGYMLKSLAIREGIPFGHISKKKFEEIAKVYKLSGLIDNNYTLDDFFYHLSDNKYQVKIGVLAKRGLNTTHKRWGMLAKYLNHLIDSHHFSIEPLSFAELEDSVKNNKVDFVITNTMYYVILESKYGISRIATLINSDKEHILKEFGGVIFTKSDNDAINELEDLEHKNFGAVSRLSFGGWIMGYEELLENGIDENDIDLSFLNTHDAVVKAVLSGELDAGTVRTDTLERMALEGEITLSDIKVIGAKKYEGFSYLVSTKLYPEWPIAKLKNTSNFISNRVLASLITYEPSIEDLSINNIAGWTVPLDYSSVHALLKKLRLAPYDKQEIKFLDVVENYAVYFYIFGLLIVVLITRLIYDWRLNKHLSQYSAKLHEEVLVKTEKLVKMNKKLKVIAQTDSLTGISNRGYFMKFANKYFDIAKRNNEDLQILSLDLDFFKNINDTYGHQAGDDVLKKFVDTISSLLRKSDMFGRIGGEEFCIVLQKTSQDGAHLFAQRICNAIEGMSVESGANILKTTVSIGLASLSDEKSVDELIKKSDIALYEAKESGRNQVKLYSKN